MSTAPSDRERLRDLALLRRVRDRIDREYAQPLDGDAAGAAHRQTGQESRSRTAGTGLASWV